MDSLAERIERKQALLDFIRNEVDIACKRAEKLMHELYLVQLELKDLQEQENGHVSDK